jgi:Zn-dependent peptidase ImmA (M78 family)
VTPAERLLRELGITEPAEIDLEAIAFHVGARVRKRALTGCEAHILGCADRAIITLNKNSSPRRRRFSIAHELGHWCHHRGKTLICRADEYQPRDAMSPEKVADSYAADLVMPRYLFQPCARQFGRLNFDAVEKLADAFETSLTATAIRLIDFDHSPAFVISHSPGEAAAADDERGCSKALRGDRLRGVRNEDVERDRIAGSHQFGVDAGNVEHQTTVRPFFVLFGRNRRSHRESREDYQ